MSKTRNYVFTIHNYTKKEVKNLKKLGEELEKHHYLCFGLEVAPETGTKHIQGYIQLNESQRLTYLHRYFNIERKGKLLKFHIESAIAGAEKNIDYTGKDGDFYEFGEPITKGQRTDLVQLKERIKEDPRRYREIVDEDVVNQQQFRFARDMSDFYLEARNPDTAPVVFWLSGSSGVGKTRLVYQSFGKENVCAVSDWNWPGTGYRQQECLLLDDFRAENIDFNKILKITDRYPYQLAYKGGFVELNSPVIVITSPKSIKEEYSFIAKHEDLVQLTRRVTEIDMDAFDAIDIDLRTYHQGQDKD